MHELCYVKTISPSYSSSRLEFLFLNVCLCISSLHDEGYLSMCGVFRFSWNIGRDCCLAPDFSRKGCSSIWWEMIFPISEVYFYPDFILIRALFCSMPQNQQNHHRFILFSFFSLIFKLPYSHFPQGFNISLWNLLYAALSIWLNFDITPLFPSFKWSPSIIPCFCTANNFAEFPFLFSFICFGNRSNHFLISNSLLYSI